MRAAPTTAGAATAMHATRRCSPSRWVRGSWRRGHAAAELVRAAAKECNTFAPLIAHGDVVDASALRARALFGDRRQLVAEVCGEKELDRRGGCNRHEVIGIAGERECAVGEREDQSTVAEGVAVNRVLPNLHGKGGV